MTEIFLDTSFVIALTVPGDAFHAIAVQWAEKLRKERALLVTTQGILAEIDGGAQEERRRTALWIGLSALGNDSVSYSWGDAPGFYWARLRRSTKLRLHPGDLRNKG